MQHLNSKIRAVQNISYDILKKFDVFCKNHSIEYCLFYGTALGAHRHNGFIPWDDDIDLIMTRENFDKVRKNQKNLPSGLSLFENPQKNRVPKIFSKDNNFRTLANDQGVFIDIFPISFLSLKQKEDLEICKEIDDIWEHRKTVKKSSLMKYFLYRTFLLPIKRYGDNKRKGIIKKIKESNSIRDEYICYIWNDKMIDTVFKWSDVYPFSYHKFEDREFPVPRNLENILRITYGDYYMTPIKKHIHYDYKN